jgi:flagellar hook assembly protein FlgD
VVPNPYYAYSAYENSQIDSRIKVTNLPGKCTIKIYTLGGTLVRTLRKDDLTTYVEWDMKNQQRIPVASGTYIIHVDAGDLGTKTLKWFCIMRPIDLDTF